MRAELLAKESGNLPHPGEAADKLDEVGPAPIPDLFLGGCGPGCGGRGPPSEGRRRVIYAGVDIAKFDHVIGAVDETGAEAAKPMRFKNGEDGFERCVAWLESVAESEDDVFVGMEATGHYWMACFAYLSAAGYKVCVVNPMQVRAMRKLKGLAGVKNDRIDSWLIAETLRQGDYDETRLATDDVQALKRLTRYHQGLKQELATVKTQALCVLDAYFPEYAALFSDAFGAASLRVLAECPTPAEVGRRRASTIARLLSDGSRGRLGDGKAAQHQGRREVLGGHKARRTGRVVPDKDDGDPGRVPQRHHSEGRGRGGGAAREGRAEHHHHPRRVHRDRAQIAAEIGDVGRFKNAAAVVKYAAQPGVSESGTFSAQGVPITKHGSPYLRRALWLAANRARQHDPKLRAFYEKKRREGKPHRVAVTAVARKLCHVVYAVDRRPGTRGAVRPGKFSKKT